MSIFEIAYGFIKVANEAMAWPIWQLTQSRGFDPRTHILSTFGGAGGQHACALAKILGISTIFIHQYAGILSAYGMGLADIVEEREEPIIAEFKNDSSISQFNDWFEKLCQAASISMNHH